LAGNKNLAVVVMLWLRTYKIHKVNHYTFVHVVGPVFSNGFTVMVIAMVSAQ